MDGKIFNSRGVHVAIILGPTIFNLKGQKIYDLRGVNIYKLSGELVGHLTDAQSCACRKLNPGILVMQSAQDWATKNVPGAIDGARDRRIFLQG